MVVFARLSSSISTSISGVTSGAEARGVDGPARKSDVQCALITGLRAWKRIAGLSDTRRYYHSQRRATPRGLPEDAHILCSSPNMPHRLSSAQFLRF